LVISLILMSACAPLVGTLEVEVAGQPEGSEGQSSSAPLQTEPVDAPFPSLGSAMGKVCYPSESIQAMTGYFQHQGSGALTPLEIGENQATYRVDLEPGVYIAFAYTQDNALGGMYSEAVACGLSVECQDHAPRPFEVLPGRTTERIDLCDWYAQDQLPPAPGASAQPGPFQAAAGLVYSDLSANETWQIDSNGFPQKLYGQAGALPSGDGRRLLLERDDDLWIADRTAGTETNLTGGNDRLEADGQWWPSNPNTLVFSSADNEQGWGMSAGQPTIMSLDGLNYRTLAATSGFWGPAPAPDGNTIAYDSGDAAWLYHLDGNVLEQFDTAGQGLESPPDLKIGSPSWSPDGRRLAWWAGGSFGGGPFRMGLALFDLPTKSARFLHQYQPQGGSGGWLPPAQWSPDGQWLAFTTRGEGRTPGLWVARSDGGEAHDLGTGALPLWSPDGQKLIYLQYDQTGNFAGLYVVNRQTWQPLSLGLPSSSQPLVWLKN
jgi:hypothetical protein